MGINACIEFFKVKDKRQFQNLDEAAGSLLRGDAATPEAREKVRAFLEGFLSFRNNSYVHETTTRWALIWWRKE